MSRRKLFIPFLFIACAQPAKQGANTVDAPPSAPAVAPAPAASGAPTAAPAPPSAEGALTVAQLSAATAGQEVTLKGYVQGTGDCCQIEGTPNCGNTCDAQYIQLLDAPLAQSHALVIAAADAAPFHRGGYYVFSGVVLTLAELDQLHYPIKTVPALRASSHVATTPAPATLPATYADGSWSVADLRKRTDFEGAKQAKITGFVTAVNLVTCPPCPPPYKCKPCAQSSLVLADQLEGVAPLHIHAPSLSQGQVKEGARYVITVDLGGQFWPGFSLVSVAPAAAAPAEQ
jgi:hypothetical protein